MKTMTKKFLPLGTLVLAMAFFLTGCDAVLESFYPEFKDGGSNSVQKLTLNLTYDSSLKGPIVVALVPYEDLDGHSVPSDPSNWKTQTSAINQTHKLSTSFSVAAGKTYKLIAFNNDASNAQYGGANKVNKDASQATRVSVGYNNNGTFTTADVKKLGANGVSTYLSSSSKLPSGDYAELFQVGGFSLGFPDVIDTNLTYDKIKLQRTFRPSGLPAIQRIDVTLNLPSGYNQYDTFYIDPSVQSSVEIPLVDRYYGKSSFVFVQGAYSLVVRTWDGSTLSDAQTFQFYVQGASALAPGSTVNLNVGVVDWYRAGGATYAYVYYTDGFTENYAGTVSQSSGSFSTSLQYQPGWYLKGYFYDDGGNPYGTLNSYYDTASWGYSGDVQDVLNNLTSSYSGGQLYTTWNLSSNY